MNIMRSIYKLALVIFAVTLTFTSCREKSEKEKLIDEMEAEGAEIKEKSEDGEYKLKMETEDYYFSKNAFS